MNEIVWNILKAHYNEAKQTLAKRQQILVSSVRYRMQLERQVLEASNLENKDALTCQQATDKFNALRDYLRANGQGRIIEP